MDNFKQIIFLIVIITLIYWPLYRFYMLNFNVEYKKYYIARRYALAYLYSVHTDVMWVFDIYGLIEYKDNKSYKLKLYEKLFYKELKRKIKKCNSLEDIYSLHEKMIFDYITSSSISVTKIIDTLLMDDFKDIIEPYSEDLDYLKRNTFSKRNIIEWRHNMNTICNR